jgi:hypothetical protein
MSVLKYLIAFSLALFVCSSPAQNVYSCSAGQAANGISSMGQAVPSCQLFATPIGLEVYQPNLTGAMSSQTLCDTSATCPAGLYFLDLYIEPVNVGTLGAATVYVTYTSDVRTYTNLAIPSCGSISLIVATPTSCHYNFYHAANTAITTSTTVGTLVGSPTYNYRARVNLVGLQ